MERQTIRVTLIKCRSLCELEQDSEYDIINDMANFQLEMWTRQLKSNAKQWSRDMSSLKTHVSQVREILNAYASDNIHGPPSQVYSFMRNRNEKLARKIYGALMRLLMAPDITRHEVIHSLLAAFIEHLQGMFTAYEYQRLASTSVGIKPKNHSTHTSLKRKPGTDGREALMRKAINETVESYSHLGNRIAHDYYDELRRVSKLPTCPLQ